MLSHLHQGGCAAKSVTINYNDATTSYEYIVLINTTILIIYLFDSRLLSGAQKYL